MPASPTPMDAAGLWRRAMAAFGQAPDRALQDLASSAQAGFAPAQSDLGRVLLHGVGVPPDAARGLHWLQRAEALGEPRAAYSLAVADLAGIRHPQAPGTAARRLRRAASAGHPPALRSLALALARGPEPAEAAATACLERAAGRGDGISLALLAWRLAEGRGCRRDLARARTIAARLGPSLPGIALPAASELGNAVSPGRDSSVPAPPGPLPLPDLAGLLAAPARARVLHAAPRVATADAALTPEECRLLILLGGPHLRPSRAVRPEDGATVAVELRTSFDMVFDPVIEDLVLVAIQQRMAAFAGLPLANAEPPVLLRYGPGQEYRPHRDYLPPSRVRPTADGGSGQRSRTVLAYLCGVEAGGATVFPELGLSVAPGTGGLLRFDNLDAGGRPDPRTLHAGLPVERGEKWVCTLWVREGAHRAPGPGGRPVPPGRPS